MMLLDRLKTAADSGALRQVDVALADWGLRHGGSQPVALALALASRAVGDGHTCLSLESDFAPAVPGEAPFCEPGAFRDALGNSPLVGAPDAGRPLILDGARLYLQRYWQYECRLAARLRDLIASEPAPVDTRVLGPDGGLFAYDWVADTETHWQAVAAATALRHRLAVISGGPGTGKTYTVLRLIRLLIEDAERHDRPAPVIRLAAPTGKAAARMMESTRAGLAALPDGTSLAERLPDAASTLHRLLGLTGRSTQPRHNRQSPLTADVVIVDEASMVDLPMMAKLADAIPAHGRLILLGDRYQLASVESGAVLAELCDSAGMNAFTAAQRKAFAPLLKTDAGAAAAPAPPLADHVVTLQTSHRFTADSAIGQLAAAVNAGDTERATTLLAEHPSGIDNRLGRGADLDAVVEACVAAHAPLMDLRDPAEALRRLNAHRLLTATRVGPAGSDHLNQRVHDALCQRFGLDPEQRWYPGRPVIVQHNDYRVGLFNGDTGICLDDADGRLRVWFETPDGLRDLLPTALPRHDSVFAMTIHKSQGSEFEHVSLLLPDQDLPVLTRELIYTGITRARESVTLHGGSDAFRAAVQRATQRHSGLAERLAAPAPAAPGQIDLL